MYATSNQKKALHVNGAPPRASGQSRLNAQAVRDEVVSRLSEMLQEAEQRRDDQMSSGGNVKGSSPTSSPQHRRLHCHVDSLHYPAAIAARSGAEQQQLCLPAIAGASSRHTSHNAVLYDRSATHHHQGVVGSVTRLAGGGGVDNDGAVSSMSSNSSFAASGNPLAIVRQCIKHFLSTPSVYGNNVRTLLDEELRYVINIWASSSADPADPAAGGGGSFDQGVNIVQDNFFERVLRLEVERRQREGPPTTNGHTTRRHDEGAALSSALDDLEGDDAFVDARQRSGTLVPQRPSLNDTAHSVALSASGGLVSPPKLPLSSSVARGNATTQLGRSGAGGVNNNNSVNENFEVTTLRRKMKALEQMNTVLSEQLNARSIELRDEKAERREMDKQMEKLEAKIMQGKREKETLEVQLADLRVSLDDQLLKVTNFRDEEEDKRRTTEERLRETRGEMSQVYSELKNAQNQLVASQKELDRAVEECERLQGELDTAHRRLRGATHVVCRRNRTLSLMQALIHRRRTAHRALQQCVKELEVFAGAGTLTELYLASDPAWSAFLYYRLHRHVFHVTSNVGVPSVLTSASQLTRDTALFSGTSEGGAWRAANFSTELLLRLVLSNNGEYRIAMDDHAKAGTTGLVAASPRSASIGSAAAASEDGCASPSGSKHHHLFARGRGGCMGLQWNSSPYQVRFARTQRSKRAATDTSDASPTTAPSLADDSSQNESQGGNLDASVSSLSATATTATSKCQPVLCIEALLLPPPLTAVKKLNVPATQVATQHRNAVAAGDNYAAETLAALLPPPYQPRCEPVEDTMKLRRSDVRLVLYGMWKERYRQYMDHFQTMRAARSDAAKIPKALEASVQPLGSFITFVYVYLSQRFPVGGASSSQRGARRQSSVSGGVAAIAAAAVTAAAVAPGYHQPMDVASVVVRPLIGEDRVAYCHLRSNVRSRPTADLPLGGKYAPTTSNAALNTQTGDSLVALSPAAKEVLCALLHYSYEYKEVDADFRLFYMVSHQLLPEALAINFYAMTEAIFRDCDEAVLSTISEKLAASVRGQLSPPKRKHRAPSLSSLANAPTPPSTALAASGMPVPGAGSLKDLYEEDPLTRMETKFVDPTKQAFNFDDPSSSEDDETSILADKSSTLSDSAHRARGTTGHSEGDVSLTSSPSLGPSFIGAPSSLTPVLGPHGGRKARQQPAANSSNSLHVPQGADATRMQRQQSELLHRNGLISIHQFLQVIEKHCFATYQLVKETAKGGHELDGDVPSSDPSSHRVSPSRHSTSPPSSDGSEDEDDSTTPFDVLQVYREEAHRRLEEDASNASPLYRIGYVPLTSMQAQRLKFALSLDQPSSVVKYASLFRPDTGAARPSHFYDELLTMVIDHHLTIQDVVMDELVLPACRCRHETPVAGAVTCDGEILVSKLLLNTIRWVEGIQPPSDIAVQGQPATSATTMPSKRPGGEGPMDVQPTPLSVQVPPDAMDGAPMATTPKSSKQALYIDIAARRFVLQLCEACPRENTSGQFVDSVLTLPSLALVERFEARHQQVSATLDYFTTLPLHHLALKLRTTLFVFDVAQQTSTTAGAEPGQNASLPPTVTPFPPGAMPKTNASPRGAGAAGTTPVAVAVPPSALVSKLSFQPPPRELMDVFRQEMEAACAECDQRTACQRALHNDLLAVLPKGSTTAGRGQRSTRSVAISDDKTPPLGSIAPKGLLPPPGSNNPSKQYLQLHSTSIDTSPGGIGSSTDAGVGDGSASGGGSADGGSVRQRSLSITVSGGGGAADMTTHRPSFRFFYESGDGGQGEGGSSSEAAAKAVAVLRKSTSTSRKKGGVSEAIDQAFDAARLAVTTQTLSQIQESKIIPLDLGLAAMLKRQLGAKFPIALLPPMGDLQVYHKALMSALLKPIDDATDHAPPSAVLGRQTSFHGERRKPTHDEDPSTVEVEAPGRSNLAKSASFSLKRLSKDMDQQQMPAHRGAATAPGEGIPEARRRLGSIAMGIYSSLT